MTIVVTGGAGRLGRSVVRRFIDDGHRVVNLDRQAADIDGLVNRIVDLTDPVETAAALVAEHPRSVIHLAAIAVPFSAPEEQILAVNTAIAYNVLTASAAAGAESVLAASSPTVIGYGAPDGWMPQRLPIDERHPVAPWNAYSASKVTIETLVGMAARRDGSRVRFGAFRPCYVVTPEEWRGAPTQQGHTIEERLDHPELAAVSLFNYVDARDAADFVATWVDAAGTLRNGAVFFVGAADALAREPLAELIPRYLPALRTAAAGLTGSAPAFDCSAAQHELGWIPTRSWRTELPRPESPAPGALLSRGGIR